VYAIAFLRIGSYAPGLYTCADGLYTCSDTFSEVLCTYSDALYIQMYIVKVYIHVCDDLCTCPDDRLYTSNSSLCTCSDVLYTCSSGLCTCSDGLYRNIYIYVMIDMHAIMIDVHVEMVYI